MSPEVEYRGLDTIQDFIFKCSNLRKTSINPLDFGEFGDNLQSNGRIGQLEYLLPVNTGLYLPTNLYDEMDMYGKVPDRIDFKNKSALSIGRQNSRRKVFFGEQNYYSFSDSTPWQKQVAVKPYLGSAKKRYLAQEISMYSILRELGEDCPKIVGLLKPDSSTQLEDYFLLTEFKSAQITLDTIDWQNINSTQKDFIISRGLSSILNLHSHQISHGDAHPRNITIQPNVENNWYVDMEYSVKTNNPLDLMVGIKADLRAFYYGICELEKRLPSFDDMLNRFLVPYLILLSKCNRKDDNIISIEKILPKIFVSLQQEFNVETDSTNSLKNFGGGVLNFASTL